MAIQEWLVGEEIESVAVAEWMTKEWAIACAKQLRVDQGREELIAYLKALG